MNRTMKTKYDVDEITWDTIARSMLENSAQSENKNLKLQERLELVLFHIYLISELIWWFILTDLYQSNWLMKRTFSWQALLLSLRKCHWKIGNAKDMAALRGNFIRTPRWWKYSTQSGTKIKWRLPSGRFLAKAAGESRRRLGNVTWFLLAIETFV